MGDVSDKSNRSVFVFLFALRSHERSRWTLISLAASVCIGDRRGTPERWLFQSVSLSMILGVFSSAPFCVVANESIWPLLRQEAADHFVSSAPCRMYSHMSGRSDRMHR